jgi:hypothetical protein
MSCIIGTIMYCTAAIHIPGPLHSQQSYLGNEAWRYAAYYGAPIQRPYVVLPAAFPVTRRG